MQREIRRPAHPARARPTVVLLKSCRSSQLRAPRPPKLHAIAYPSYGERHVSDFTALALRCAGVWPGFRFTAAGVGLRYLWLHA